MRAFSSTASGPLRATSVKPHQFQSATDRWRRQGGERSARAGTYVNAAFLGTPLLTPADFGCLALTEAEHAQHVPHPKRHALDEAYLDVAAGSLEVDIRPRDKVPEDIDRFRCVERIAECCTECRLAGMQAVIRCIVISNLFPPSLFGP